MTDDMTVVELLRAARALIGDPDHWTQGALACDEHDEEVDPEDPNACRWCAVGACIAVTPMRVPAIAVEDSLGRLVREMGHYYFIVDFNDDPATTHADILALYDDAIRAEEAKRA